MRDKEKDAAQMAEKRQNMLEKGFMLFSEKSIDAVSMPDVAKACGYGIATLYRYFNTKLDLVVAIGTWKWQEFLDENEVRRESAGFHDMNAAEQYEFSLDTFFELYRNHIDLLMFNHAFNLYVRGEANSVEMSSYVELVKVLTENFHETYEKGKIDGTLRTDINEEEIFITTIHLMLAAVTRYAVGLIYIPEHGYTPEKELYLLKGMLMKEFTL